MCRNVMPEWLDVVRAKRSVISFKKGELIFQEGEQVKGIYFILTGKVKIDMSWGDKKYIVRFATDGAILGHRGYGLENTYPVSGTALEQTEACFIPSELFQTLLKTNPPFLFELAFFYADELKRTERRMKNLVHMPVKGRVVESLLMLRDTFGTAENFQLKFKLARKDLASMAGTTYETTIRMLNELSAENLIQLKDKDIILLDQKKLEQCCIATNH